MQRDYKLYLTDILDSIDKIETYVGTRSYEQFKGNSLLIDGITRNFGAVMKSIDIVFPKNNEKEFLKIAKALGKKEIVFVYSPKDYKEWKEKESITIKTAILAPAKEGYYLKQKYPLLIVKANQETDKWVVEHVKPWLIYGFEDGEKKDFMHHRNSGMDHILVHQMAEHGVSYGFSVDALIHASPEQQAILLGRMRQNVFMLKKAKVPMYLMTLSSDPRDMRNEKDVWCLV